MLLTSFGYYVDAEALPPIIDADDLDTLAPGHGLSEEAAELMCEAVSEAIRSYCGWHVAPVLDCEIEATACGNLVALPATQLLSVYSVESDGADVSNFEWLHNGLVRSCGLSQKWRGVKVAYEAGHDSKALKLIAANMVKGELRANPGISSETAGGVSVSYSASSFAFSRRDETVLKPYRVAVEP